MKPHRVTFLMTHPVQYLAPWFRWIQENEPRLQLTVLYATQPAPAAQAEGFGGAFTWDGNLLEGYDARVLSDVVNTPVGADRFSSIDVPHLEAALADTDPALVVVPGWHAAVYRRAFAICERRRIPLVYRGDSQLGSGPRGLKRWAWRWATRQRLSRYSAWLAVGTRSQEYLRAFGVPDPLIFASPHCVDSAAFADVEDRVEARHRFGLEPGRFSVLFAGKLVEKKRPLDAIAATAMLRDAQLLVVGSGPLEQECRAAAQRLGVRVTFAGFLNQHEMPAAYAASDCLVLPSDGRETWGLVVNEAMSAGRPAVVSAAVGCQPDLVHEGATGAVAADGDVKSLAAALGRVQAQHRNGHSFEHACREVVARHSFAAATQGLVEAADRLRTRQELTRANQAQTTQVLACCGHMVVAGGLERMTFEVLGALRHTGVGVHALVNVWDSARIVRLAEAAGVRWELYRCEEPLVRRPSPMRLVRMAMEVARSSWDVLTAAQRHRATHVLLPDFLIALRNWPALLMLRLSGCRIVLRVGMAPTRSAFYGRLWRWGVSTAVDRIVCNSTFIYNEVLALGVSPPKVSIVRNTVATRRMRHVGERYPYRVVYAGQLIPGKGVDLLLEAVARLRAEGMPVTLDVVGNFSGWESPSYQGHQATLVKRVNDADLRDAVRLLGVRDDVPELMAEAAVHCCPSRQEIREGMAGVVLEAKSVGTPSVVSISGSLPELVRHRIDGWVAEDTVEGIAEGLRYFLADDSRRESAGLAARMSLQQFNRETFERGWRREFGLLDTTDEERSLAVGRRRTT